MCKLFPWHTPRKSQMEIQGSITRWDTSQQLNIKSHGLAGINTWDVHAHCFVSEFKYAIVFCEV